MTVAGFSDVTVRLTTAGTTSVRAKVLRLRPGSEKAVEYAPSDPSVRGDVEQHIETKGATLPLELLIRAFEAQLAVTAPELVGRKWALFCGFEGTGGGGGRRVIPMFRVGTRDNTCGSAEGKMSLCSLLEPFLRAATLETTTKTVWSVDLTFVVSTSMDEPRREVAGAIYHVSFVPVANREEAEGQNVVRKDPNAPTRPPRTAFALYCTEMRSIFVRQHGEAAGLRLMVGAWKEADEATRAKFEAFAKADRDRYEKEFREFWATGAS